MSKKKYRKKTTRSRRKPITKESGRVVSAQDGVIQLAFPIPQILAATHGAIEALCGEAGLLVMKALMRYVQELCLRFELGGAPLLNNPVNKTMPSDQFEELGSTVEFSPFLLGAKRQLEDHCQTSLS